MRLALVAVAVLGLYGAAHAQTVPEFDSFSWCWDKTPFGSYDVNGVPACEDNEEMEAAALQQRYSQIPASIRANCESYAVRVGNGWGSYSALAACIGRHEKHTWKLPPQ